MDQGDEQQAIANEFLQKKQEAGGFFDLLMREKGWEYIEKFYRDSLESFMVQLMGSNKPIEEFENMRQQLIGVKTLIDYAKDCVESTKESPSN